MPRVLLAGAFGQGNPGDEAVLQAVLGAVDGFDAVATSSDPPATAALHGIAAVYARDARAVARATRASDAVVFAGGTVFKTLDERYGRHPLALLASAATLAAAARATGRPLAMVGVGVGALRTPAARRLARGLVRTADLLVLRDEEAASALAEAGAPVPLRVGADPSWRLVAPAAAATAGGGTIVVALSRLAGGPDLGERLAGALRPALAAGLRVQLQPWGCSRDAIDDRYLAAEIRRRLAGAVVELVTPPADLDDAARLFAGVRLVVALRFQAIPAAAAAGVPVLALEHERELGGIARRLRQPSVPAGAPPERIARAIMGALDHPAPAPDVVAAEIAAATEQLRLLHLLLRRGESVHAEHDLTGLALHPEEWVA